VSGDAATLDAPASSGSAPRTWDHFEIVGRVGGGGGGEVFRARDTRLARDVALKLLHGERADLAACFRREAQAQARIEHPHVCKVYEVGENAGRSYIAMQFVDGPTLAQAAAEMTVEERVRIVRDVAEAVHAAHRLGIVHRDLKPGNVMVERDADGARHAWVVDFGLARELERDETATATAGVVGTPAFMPPEQARGDGAAIDRRADVYGLGATLFAVLAGRAPYVGTSIDVLVQVASSDPPPLRAVAPTMPADLQTIVARCLERDPAARYPSAREVAEELDRFLDGEPIHARPRPWWARAARRLRRQRAVVGVSAAAVIALAVVGALWLRSRARAREDARLAQQLGQEAQAIDNAMRIAHLLPAHDLRPDRARLRERLRALEDATASAGGDALGPGQYALGRGALALGDRDGARAHLEQAWQAGYRTPDVACALGEVLGDQYEAALAAAASIEDPDTREAARRTAARDLRDPALAYLHQARGADIEPPALIEGLIAYREGRTDEALARLADAARAAPSVYEAQRLIGGLETDLAHARGEAGDTDGALAHAARAADAYAAAAAIARSDEGIQIGECERRFELIQLDWDHGRPSAPSAEDALAACDRALTIDPDSVDAYREAASVLWRMGEAEAAAGTDPRPTLARAIERAQAGLARDPKDARTLTALGTAWLTQAVRWEAPHGIDPRPALDKAVDALERSIASAPTPHALVDVADAQASIADWDAAHGTDPRPSYDRAAGAFRRAIALAPHYSDAYIDLGTVYGAIADYDVRRGLDPRAAVADEITAEQQAIAIKADNSLAWNDLAGAWAERIEWEWGQGIDTGPSSTQQIRALETSISLKPDYPYAHDNLAEAHRYVAREALARGADPTPALDRGRAEVAVARKLAADDPYSWQFGASLELLAARAAHDERDAAARFADADAAIARALAIDPDSADAHVVAAEIARWRGEAHRERGEPVADDVTRGLASAARALAIHPDLPTAHAVRGALLALDGKAADAKAALDRARELDPLLARDYPR
jgi:serine/threonine-protein kinase